VRGIVLHTAPVAVLDRAAVAGLQPPGPSGAGLMTAEQYVDAAGAEIARDRDVWVRGGLPDYTAGEHRRVGQAVALGRDPVGTARRYLSGVVPGVMA